MSNSTGILYLVATPIGNMADVSQRALKILATVDLIAAEDTRHTAILLRQYGIRTAMTSYHEHNEAEAATRLVAVLATGTSIALVSDAGTPLISDPGLRLVRAARQQGITVISIPGPSALICALTASGLSASRFLFIGFPPRSSEQRQTLFLTLTKEHGTIIFYEAGNRLQETIADLEKTFGTQRQIVLARELTKHHETFLLGNAATITKQLTNEPIQMKGEHVLLVEGAGYEKSHDTAESTRILRILMEELPLKQAASLTARISGSPRNDLYRLALTFNKTGSPAIDRIDSVG